MFIHREGTRILIIALLVLLSFNIILMNIVTTSNWFSGSCLIFSMIFYAWMLYFFRNPDRYINIQQNAILSPADGQVVAIQRVYEDEYLKRYCIQVSIFMSIFNVHVNRSPITGTVQYFKYHPGVYLVAFHPKSSTKNERSTVVVKRSDGLQILFRQIAGLLARRIKFYAKEGDVLQQGDEVGFIKFGSRIDIFLPIEAQLQVKLRDPVQGGVSVLAELSMPSASS